MVEICVFSLGIIFLDHPKMKIFCAFPPNFSQVNPAIITVNSFNDTMMPEIVYELRIETISVQMILKVMDRIQAVVRESTNIAEVWVQVPLRFFSSYFFSSTRNW